MLHRTSRRLLPPLFFTLLAIALLAFSAPAHAIGVICPGCARGEHIAIDGQFDSVVFE